MGTKTEQTREPDSQAKYLLDHPLINKILDELEHDAFEAIVHTDDEDRRVAQVWEVRSIRSLRQKLKTLADGGKTTLRKNRNVA